MPSNIGRLVIIFQNATRSRCQGRGHPESPQARHVRANSIARGRIPKSARAQAAAFGARPQGSRAVSKAAGCGARRAVVSIKWTKSPRPHSRSHHRGAARHCGNHNPFRLPAHRVAMKTMANSEAIAVRLQETCIAQGQRRQKSSIQATTIAALPIIVQSGLTACSLRSGSTRSIRNSRSVSIAARSMSSGFAWVDVAESPELCSKRTQKVFVKLTDRHQWGGKGEHTLSSGRTA